VQSHLHFHGLRVSKSGNANLYPRYFNTPNRQVIAGKMAALEKGDAAVVFGSGMAAIATLLLAHLKPGDHANFQKRVSIGIADEADLREDLAQALASG